MAIYEHHFNELPYYRIFRAWGGTEYQEYVRIKRSKKAAYKKAEIIDERLSKRQRAYILQMALTPEFHIHKNGKVRGLRRITVKRAGREDTEVFELRINVPWTANINRTTVSVKVHGAQNAFNKCIDLIIEWYGLTPQSDVVKAIRDTYPLYGIETVSSCEIAQAEPVEEDKSTPSSNVTEWLKAGIKKFQTKAR